MSSVDIPFATRLTTSETVIRIPRMQARPPITAGSNVIRSNIGLVYQAEEPSDSHATARARVCSGIRALEVNHFVTSELATRTPNDYSP